ncbi:MAG: CHAT domain-containing protein [Gammaproteobacteria bacterium]
MKSWAGSVIGVAVLLNGCGSHERPTAIHAAECLSVSGAAAAKLSATVPTDGILRALARPDGVSIVAKIGGEVARSPIDRYGGITFVRRVHAGETVTLAAESRDSPDIVGQVCLSMDLLPPTDAASIRAERAFAAAARSVEADEAQRAFDQYLDAAREFDSFDRFRAAEARHAMAELAYVLLARQDDAFWLARAALAGYGDRPPPGLTSGLLVLEARTLLESERFTAPERRARVLDLLEQARKRAGADRFGDREQPRIDILRGFMDYQAGSNSQASAWFENAASRCERLQDWECYARALQNQAALAEEARDYTVALRAFANVLRVLPPSLDRQLTADIWGNQGSVQVSARLFDQGERSHRVSIRLHAEIGDCAGARVGISRLGALLVQVGSLADGVSALSEATSLECPALLAAAKSGIDEAAIPRSHVCTGALQADTLDASGKFAMFHALIGLREALESENRPDEARGCLQSAAAYASSSRTQLRLENARAYALIQQDKPREAVATFERGLANADRDGIPPSQENRAAAYLGLAQAALIEGKPVQARSYAHRSLLLGSTRADMGQIVDSLQLLAQTFNAPTESDQALDILHTAAALAEQVPISGLDAEKRATWLASQHAVFAEMTRLYATGAAANGSPPWQAFEASERGRARSLRYAMNLQPGTESADETERFQQLMQRISRLVEDGQSSEVPQISLEALARIAGARDTEDIESRNLLKRKLAELDASAVEYATGREEMYAFVIDGSGISVTRLGKTREIAAAADSLYDKVRNRESAYSDVQRAAAKLAQLVLWPISAKLTHRRVFVIPDDSLHTVPFAVLPWLPGTDAPLLLERAELAVMPSMLFVTHPRSLTAQRGGSPRLELIGDPVLRAARWERECAGTESAPPAQRVAPPNRRSLPDLPGSRKEVLAIEQLARHASAPMRVSTRLGCAATPAALRTAAATSPELLHIATHGYVDAYRPRLSALALTQDTVPNGGASTFGLLDILNMRVDSRLVVLSACDTSRGRLLPGEGVLGPAQAFLQAGAASVVASYWRIPDEHTAPFMETFYRFLLVDRLSAAAALRRTQLDYARDRASLDWAAFTLYGWPDTTL